MKSVFIASARRTPIGKFGGSFSNLTAVDLGVVAVQAALDSAGVEAGDVDEVIMGQARQAGNGPNPGRQVGIRSGVPERSPAYTVNQACGSGLKSIILAYQEILLGRAHVVVAGGMESMSRVPYLVEEARWGLRLGHQPFVDGMYRDGFFCPLADMLMGEDGRETGPRSTISAERNRTSSRRGSQNRAAKASKDGRFSGEDCSGHGSEAEG